MDDDQKKLTAEPSRKDETNCTPDKKTRNKRATSRGQNRNTGMAKNNRRTKRNKKKTNTTSEGDVQATEVT